VKGRERELRQQRIHPLLGVKEGVKRKGDNNVYSSIYVFYWSLRRDKSRGVYRKLSEEMRVRNREKKTLSESGEGFV
jgi:hypothetical protein